MSTEDNESLHFLRATIEGDWLSLSFECHAAEGAECRKHCPAGCETWPCEHDLVDAGECTILPWMEDFERENHEGAAEPIHDGMPVEFEWDGDGYTWHGIEQRGDLNG